MQDFLALVDRLSAAGDHQRPGIEAEIWRRFGVFTPATPSIMGGFETRGAP